LNNSFICFNVSSDVSCDEADDDEDDEDEDDNEDADSGCIICSLVFKECATHARGGNCKLVRLGAGMVLFHF